MSKEYKVLLVGAGGVGIRLANDVARLLQYQAPGSGMIIVDGDTFEPKNKERQQFDQIGNKAEVLAAALSEEFTSVMFIPQPQWVVTEVVELEEDDGDDEDEAENAIDDKVAASDLLDDGDIVFAVVDNFAARKAIFDAAREIDNIDVFTGGNEDADGDPLFGSIYHYQRRDGQDVTEHPVAFHHEYENPPDRNPGEMSCSERAKLKGGAQTLAANAGVAAYLLARAYRVMFEEGFDVAPESEIYFDLGKGLSQPYDRSIETNKVKVPEGVTV